MDWETVILILVEKLGPVVWSWTVRQLTDYLVEQGHLGGGSCSCAVCSSQPADPEAFTPDEMGIDPEAEGWPDYHG